MRKRNNFTQPRWPNKRPCLVGVLHAYSVYLGNPYCHPSLLAARSLDSKQTSLLGWGFFLDVRLYTRPRLCHPESKSPNTNPPKCEDAENWWRVW